MELRFRVASASQPQCADIQLIDDSILENDETFFVMLTSTDRAVTINPNAATVTINDDDGKPIIIFLLLYMEALSSNDHTYSCRHWFYEHHIYCI